MHKVAVAGAVLAALADVAYLAIIGSQPSRGAVSLRVAFVAGFIGVMAMFAVLGTLRQLDRWAPLLLSMSAGGRAVFGLVAIFSIGILVLAAAVLVVVPAVQSSLGRRQPAGMFQVLGGLVAVIALFVAGVQLTEIPVACPAVGYAEGSGSDLFSLPTTGAASMAR